MSPVVSSTSVPSPSSGDGSSTSRHGGAGSKIAIAFRALTSARVTFWANSKKVRIGPIR